MRSILLIIFITLPWLVTAQQREKLETVNPIYSEYLPVENGLITYSEVVQVENISKDDLFIRANSWIVKTFNSAKDVIQYNDKEAGKIICKTVTGATVGRGLNRVTIDPVYYLLQIEVREGRYRISATEFIHEYTVPLSNTTGENRLEQYYLLKNPTKREADQNIAVAQIIQEKVMNVFSSAETSIANYASNDDW